MWEQGKTEIQMDRQALTDQNYFKMMYPLINQNPYSESGPCDPPPEKSRSGTFIKLSRRRWRGTPREGGSGPWRDAAFPGLSPAAPFVALPWLGGE